MSLRVLDALPILITRLGETINKVPNGNARAGLENKKAMGFMTSKRSTLALDVYPANMGRVRLWIEPPHPPSHPGVSVLTSKHCADLDRAELRALSGGKGAYLEIEDRKALIWLLDWYC